MSLRARPSQPVENEGLPTDTPGPRNFFFFFSPLGTEKTSAVSWLAYWRTWAGFQVLRWLCPPLQGKELGVRHVQPALPWLLDLSGRSEGTHGRGSPGRVVWLDGARAAPGYAARGRGSLLSPLLRGRDRTFWGKAFWWWTAITANWHEEETWNVLILRKTGDPLLWLPRAADTNCDWVA